MDMNIGLLKLASSLATYSNKRQSLIAQNIANADTPGYRAKDLTTFQATFDRRAGDFALRSNRAGHINEGGQAGYREVHSAGSGAASPNGNTVSLEDQMIRSADVQIQHDLALGVYKKSLGIMRLGLGRR